jgi:NADH dehydrogenase [ubiquinone] 1 alpha subcomplex assembly factor 7
MLERLLRQEIQEKGPVSQYRFMELALQHPTYGYYRSQKAVGRDFITSPEISQMFGELIGIWALDYYVKLQHPKTVSLVELGPGKGTLMADFLRISKLSPSFSKALEIYLVEINSLLKAMQLKAIPTPVKWVDHFANIPLVSDPLIIIANEFFDVFPTHCYVRKNNVLYEKCVDYKEGKLAFEIVSRETIQEPDCVWEESPQAEALMQAICARLLKQHGVFLFFDYGYEEGGGDSLQALFEGNQSDPLSHIGKSDLTCHVNFRRLKDIALSQGLGVRGPIPQGHFLKNIGLEVRSEMLKQANPSQKASVQAAVTRLTHPQQMGTLFKVMAVFSPLTLIPLGFES